MACNNDVRLAARGAGVPLWLVAKNLGMSESTFFRLLRNDLDGEMKKTILEVIEALKQEGC